MVTGEITAILPAGSMGFWASGPLLSILAGTDIGGDADATPTAKGAEGLSTMPADHGRGPARAAATPKAREADMGAKTAPLGRVVPRRLPPVVASGRGPQQEDHDAGNTEQQSSPHD